MATEELTVKSHVALAGRGVSDGDLGFSVQEEAGGLQLGPVSILQVAVPWWRGSQEGPQAAVLMLLRMRGHDLEVCLKKPA